MFLRTSFFLLATALSLTLQAQTPFVCAESESDQVPLHREPPSWPPSAILMCMEGTVVLEFTIGKDGRVTEAVVLEATQPGIFDLAAISATERWRYQPRCENGEPVATQQRTALDFMLDESDRMNCLPGARLLAGPSLELAGAMGKLYSMVAEWYYDSSSVDWPLLIRQQMTPGFDGDLGQIERFHHDFVALTLAQAEADALNEDYSVAALIKFLLAPGADPSPPADEHLAAVRRHAWAWAERATESAEEVAASYRMLRAESDLEPDLLEVLVHGFMGSPLEAAILHRQYAMDQVTLTERLLGLLENPGSRWTLQPDGIQFENEQDQQLFVQLVNQFRLLDAEVVPSFD